MKNRKNFQTCEKFNSFNLLHKHQLRCISTRLCLREGYLNMEGPSSLSFWNWQIDKWFTAMIWQGLQQPGAQNIKGAPASSTKCQGGFSEEVTLALGLKEWVRVCRQTSSRPWLEDISLGRMHQNQNHGAGESGQWLVAVLGKCRDSLPCSAVEKQATGLTRIIRAAGDAWKIQSSGSEGAGVSVKDRVLRNLHLLLTLISSGRGSKCLFTHLHNKKLLSWVLG